MPSATRPSAKYQAGPVSNPGIQPLDPLDGRGTPRHPRPRRPGSKPACRESRSRTLPTGFEARFRALVAAAGPKVWISLRRMVPVPRRGGGTEGGCGRRKARGEFRNASRMPFLLTRPAHVLARIMQKHHAHVVGTNSATAASRSLGSLSRAVWRRCHTRRWTGRARQPVVNARAAIEYTYCSRSSEGRCAYACACSLSRT